MLSEQALAVQHVHQILRETELARLEDSRVAQSVLRFLTSCTEARHRIYFQLALVGIELRFVVRGARIEDKLNVQDLR